MNHTSNQSQNFFAGTTFDCSSNDTRFAMIHDKKFFKRARTPLNFERTPKIF